VPQPRWLRNSARVAAAAAGIGFAVAAAQTIAYKLEPSNPLSRFSSRQLALLSKLNHADRPHLGRLSRIIVPDRWDADELDYSPLPQYVDELSSESKAIVVDLRAQVFGGYENGRLVRWGPVSSGDRHHRTPAGTYHLNWHARVRVSSENPDWIMPWYFNFASTMGLGLHQYALPGRPASHGCVRLLETDAQWLYRWGEGWRTADGTNEVVRPGTLVLLLGSYDFGSPQPWLKPKWWARGLSVSLQEEAAADDEE
jgi:lipoprotein-anchoring transpeptidase ErfK/SrfK